jgi:hypothetical protein
MLLPDMGGSTQDWWGFCLKGGLHSIQIFQKFFTNITHTIIVYLIFYFIFTKIWKLWLKHIFEGRDRGASRRFLLEIKKDSLNKLGLIKKLFDERYRLNQNGEERKRDDNRTPLKVHHANHEWRSVLYSLQNEV